MRRIAIVAAAAAAVVLAGCGGTTARRQVGALPAPRPSGVLTGAAAAPAANSPDNCHATASLRPHGGSSPRSVPAGSTMARIKARGKLIAGVDQNTYLFGYRDALSGKVQGFDIDVVHKIAQAIFGDQDKVQLVQVSTADRVSAVRSGRVDVVVDTMTITCDRRKSVDFSQVYFNAGERLLVDKGSGISGVGDLGGQRVCAAKGADSLGNIAATTSVRPKAVAPTDWTDCLVMLQQGQVDAVATDDTILAGLAAQDPYTRVVGKPFHDEPYGVAIAKSHPDLVAYVNGVLNRMRTDGSWKASYRHWLGAALGSAPPPPKPVYRN